MSPQNTRYSPPKRPQSHLDILKKLVCVWKAISIAPDDTCDFLASTMVIDSPAAGNYNLIDKYHRASFFEASLPSYQSLIAGTASRQNPTSRNEGTGIRPRDPNRQPTWTSDKSQPPEAVAKATQLTRNKSVIKTREASRIDFPCVTSPPYGKQEVKCLQNGRMPSAPLALLMPGTFAIAPLPLLQRHRFAMETSVTPQERK